MTDQKPKSPRKSLTRTVRMSEEEVELFDGFCASQGLTTSEALRRLARSAALLGPTFSGEARSEVVTLTRQLRAVGSNLNQAVHRMHAGHMVAEEEMRRYLGGVRDSIMELDRLYRSLCGKAHKRAAEAVTKAAL
jgi:hypothetical protein